MVLVEHILCGGILYDSYMLLSAIAHQTSLSMAYSFRSEIDYREQQDMGSAQTFKHTYYTFLVYYIFQINVLCFVF